MVTFWARCPVPSRNPAVPRTCFPTSARSTDVIVPLANGEPVGVMDALEADADGLEGVRVHQMHVLHDRPYLHGVHGDRLRHVSYFLSHVTRPAFWDGTLDLVPNHFSEVPLLLERCTTCPVVVAAASPPDRHGYFASAPTPTTSPADRAGAVLPRGHAAHAPHPRGQHHPPLAGGGVVRVGPAAGRGRAGPPARDRAIGELVAERIPDGATIQIGIGSIAAAVLDALRDHRDLGVHTELLPDGVVDLVEAGVVTGVQKEVRRNRIAATFCLGTQRLYDWLDGNPTVEMLGVDFVNDPRVIARSDGSPRSTPPPRSTSSASAPRRRSPAATGPRPAARPTSPVAPCTPRRARPSSCPRRRPATAAPASSPRCRRARW